jgi:hypothetical protein
MRRVFAAFLVGLACAIAITRPAPAQEYVILSEAVKNRLATDWDKVAKNPMQTERAYCVAFTRGEWLGEPTYRVIDIVKPDTVLHATPNEISFVCAAEVDGAALHVHPPTTCDSNGKCVLEGELARQCFPSPRDRAMLDKSGDPFGLIQCDRRAVIFFFPRQR